MPSTRSWNLLHVRMEDMQIESFTFAGIFWFFLVLGLVSLFCIASFCIASLVSSHVIYHKWTASEKIQDSVLETLLVRLTFWKLGTQFLRFCILLGWIVFCVLVYSALVFIKSIEISWSSRSFHQSWEGSRRSKWPHLPRHRKFQFQDQIQPLIYITIPL